MQASPLANLPLEPRPRPTRQRTEGPLHGTSAGYLEYFPKACLLRSEHSKILAYGGRACSTSFDVWLDSIRRHLFAVWSKQDSLPEESVWLPAASALLREPRTGVPCRASGGTRRLLIEPYEYNETRGSLRSGTRSEFLVGCSAPSQLSISVTATEVCMRFPATYRIPLPQRHRSTGVQTNDKSPELLNNEWGEPQRDRIQLCPNVRNAHRRFQRRTYREIDSRRSIDAEPIAWMEEEGRGCFILYIHGTLIPIESAMTRPNTQTWRKYHDS